MLAVSSTENSSKASGRKISAGYHSSESNAMRSVLISLLLGAAFVAGSGEAQSSRFCTFALPPWTLGRQGHADFR